MLRSASFERLAPAVVALLLLPALLFTTGVGTVHASRLSLQKTFDERVDEHGNRIISIHDDNFPARDSVPEKQTRDPQWLKNCVAARLGTDHAATDPSQQETRNKLLETLPVDFVSTLVGDLSQVAPPPWGMPLSAVWSLVQQRYPRLRQLDPWVSAVKGCLLSDANPDLQQIVAQDFLDAPLDQDLSQAESSEAFVAESTISCDDPDSCLYAG